MVASLALVPRARASIDAVPRRGSTLALLGTLLALTLASPTVAAAQQETSGGASPSFCQPGDPCSDTQPPTVTISPGTSSRGNNAFAVTVGWCDNNSLAASTRSITLNGASVTSAFGYATGAHIGCTAYATSSGTVTLHPGVNTLAASISDQQSNTGSAQVTYTDSLYMSVSTDFANFHSPSYARCAASCFTALYRHGTVPYFSLGAPRSLGLVYNGDRESVRPFIYADVSLAAGAPTVSQYWLEAKVNGTSVTFLNGEARLHFAGTSQPVRLAGQFDASDLASAPYPLQVIVTAQYADGHTEQVVDASHRLLVVNRRHAAVAHGWAVDIPHLYPQANDGAVMIAEGDGSAAFYGFTGCSGSTCGYASESDDYSRVTYDTTSHSYARVFPDSTIEIFNTLGQLVDLIDRLRDTVSYGYDSLGRLTRVTDPYRPAPSSSCDGSTSCHAAIVLAYSPNGLASITQPGADGTSGVAGRTGVGRSTAVTVDSDSLLSAITDPDGESTRFIYDPTARLSAVIDRRGDTTRYAYRADGSGKLDSLVLARVPIDAGNGATMLETPAFAYQPWQTVGVPTGPTSTAPATPVSAASATAAVTDPEGHTTSFTVDRWGQPLVTTEPLGRTTTITRSGPLPVRIVHPTGAVDSLEYDASGRVVYDASAGQPATHIYYNAYGEPTGIHGGDGPWQDIIYGHLGSDSLVTLTDHDTATLYTYHYYVDSRGRDTAFVDPLGHTTHYHYDATFGNLDTTVAPNYQRTTTQLDGNGRDSVVRHNYDVAKIVTYDSLNRQTRITIPGRGSTAITYDPLFRTQVTDAHGQLFRDSLNALGWLVQRTDPAGHALTYRYNRDGLLTSTTSRSGQTLTLRYDALHRLLSRTGAGVADSFGYDSVGRVRVGWNGISRDSVFSSVTGWTDSVVTWIGGQRFRRYYHPTARQQLDSMAVAASSGIPFLSTSVYWDSTTSLPDSVRLKGRMIRYKYNGEMLRDTVTYETAPITTQTTTFTTDHRVLRLAFPSAILDSAFGRGYGYDSLGRVSEEDRKIGAADQQLRGFGHDTLDEVTRLEYAVMQPQNIYGCVKQSAELGMDCLPASRSTEVDAFHFDSVGNITEEADTAGAVATSDGTYAPGDRQMTWGSAADSFDLDGNRVRTTGPRTVSYHWTVDGLLDTVTAGSVKLAYAYNAFGELVRRSRNGVVERYFLWDRGQLLAELDATASHPIAEYVYGPGGEPLALTGADTSTVHYFAVDGTGDVIGLFTDPNSPTQELDYDLWGNVRAVSGTLGDTNRVRWKAAMWEGDSTQLYYMHARWYDPARGRFISEDPMGVAGGINVYAYGHSDWIDRQDPTGLSDAIGAPSACDLDPTYEFSHGDCGGGEDAQQFMQSDRLGGQAQFWTCTAGAACLSGLANYMATGSTLALVSDASWAAAPGEWPPFFRIEVIKVQGVRFFNVDVRFSQTVLGGAYARYTVIGTPPSTDQKHVWIGGFVWTKMEPGTITVMNADGDVEEYQMIDIVQFEFPLNVLFGNSPGGYVADVPPGH